MATRLWYSLATLCLLSLVSGQGEQISLRDLFDTSDPSNMAASSRRLLRDECRSCNPDDCTKPAGCLAGIVKDGCGCCDVCGKVEYELCTHPGVPTPKSYYGRCGDNLECRLRTDLDPGEGPEAICYCRIEGTLCGSDNKTYDNLCQLMASAVSKATKMTIQHKGPCNTLPAILSPPENVKNTTGSSIAIMCEAQGYPTPTIEWTWTRVDGKTIYLPSDDLHVSVNMRGGPDRWQVTGWLQIIELKKDHEEITRASSRTTSG